MRFLDEEQKPREDDQEGHDAETDAPCALSSFGSAIHIKKAVTSFEYCASVFGEPVAVIDRPRPPGA